MQTRAVTMMMMMIGAIMSSGRSKFKQKAFYGIKPLLMNTELNLRFDVTEMLLRRRHMHDLWRSTRQRPQLCLFFNAQLHRELVNCLSNKPHLSLNGRDCGMLSPLGLRLLSISS